MIISGADPFLCLVYASIGNICGSVLNYFAGLSGSRFIFEKYFKLKKKDIEKGILKFKKYGRLSLFFAWMPIVGDPLTLAAGVLKINFFYFIAAVGAGKTLRYVFIILIACPESSSSGLIF